MTLPNTSMADLEAHYANVTSPRHKTTRDSLFRRIKAIPSNHNRDVLVATANACKGRYQIQSLSARLGPAVTLLTNLCGPLEKSQHAITSYLVSRQPDDGFRAGDWNGQRDPDDSRGLRPSERPVLNSKAFCTELNWFFNEAKNAGFQHAISVEIPEDDYATTNDMPWHPAEDVRGLYPGLLPEHRGVLDLHFICLRPLDLRQSRVSWVQIVDGFPCLVTPDGRKALLGPYAESIMELAWIRSGKATKAKPDPHLMHAFERPLEPIDATGHANWTRGFPGRLHGMTPHSLVETGIAHALADGASLDYILTLQLAEGRRIIALEKLETAVLDATAAGLMQGIGAIKTGQAPPGRQACIPCKAINDASATQCKKCQAKLDPRMPEEERLLRWTIHRKIDAVLALRPNESEAQRELLAYQRLRHDTP